MQPKWIKNLKEPTELNWIVFSGEMSEAARLDEELMNTRVDPVILKRTVNQDVVRQRSRAAERMPSPIRGSTYRPRRSPSPYYSSGRVVSHSEKASSFSKIDMDL